MAVLLLAVELLLLDAGGDGTTEVHVAIAAVLNGSSGVFVTCRVARTTHHRRY